MSFIMLPLRGKHMKKCNLITEINLEDFLKLNLTAYEHRTHFYNEKGEEIEHTGKWLIDSKGERHWETYKGIYSRITWDKVDLNEIVLENVEWSKQEGFKNRCICVAIHTEPPEEEIEEGMKTGNHSAQAKGEPIRKCTREEVYQTLLFKYSYLDKWITRSGCQTYLLRCDVPHLYSEKRKFCTHDDYFDIPKSETKAVYLVRY